MNTSAIESKIERINRYCLNGDYQVFLPDHYVAVPIEECRIDSGGSFRFRKPNAKTWLHGFDHYADRIVAYIRTLPDGGDV